MKKRLVFIIAILFLLVGCNNGMETPTKKVEAFLNKYQTNDKEVTDQFDVSLIEENSLTEEQKERYKKIMLDQYKNIKYKIKEEKIDGNRATVDAEIEVYDFNTSLNNSYIYAEEHKDEFYVDDVLDTVAFINYKLDQLMNFKDRITYTITFNLNRDDSKSEWKLEELSESDLQKIHGIYKN